MSFGILDLISRNSPSPICLYITLKTARMTSAGFTLGSKSNCLCALLTNSILSYFSGLSLTVQPSKYIPLIKRGSCAESSTVCRRNLPSRCLWWHPRHHTALLCHFNWPRISLSHTLVKSMLLSRLLTPISDITIPPIL